MPACGVTVVLAGLLQVFLNGPEFLALFAVLGLFGIGTVWFAPKNDWGTTRVFLAVFLAYESIGLIRLGYGLTEGMERFGFLYQMMALGPFGMAWATSAHDLMRIDRYSSWGSCGSDCGGGCGGGGCGGCGG